MKNFEVIFGSKNVILSRFWVKTGHVGSEKVHFFFILSLFSNFQPFSATFEHFRDIFAKPPGILTFREHFRCPVP